MIPSSITFSKLLNVTGSPQLALNSGRTATYTSGSGTATLTFNYTVAAGQNSSKLDIIHHRALAQQRHHRRRIERGPPALTLPVPGAMGSWGANKADRDRYHRPNGRLLLGRIRGPELRSHRLFAQPATLANHRHHSDLLEAHRNRQPFKLGRCYATAFSGLGTSHSLGASARRHLNA